MKEDGLACAMIVSINICRAAHCSSSLCLLHDNVFGYLFMGRARESTGDFSDDIRRPVSDSLPAMHLWFIHAVVDKSCVCVCV
jgi:hypothetical protein